MTSQPSYNACHPVTTDPCWRRVGVMGDSSCPELDEAVHCRNCSRFAAAGQQLFEREPPATYVAEQTAAVAQTPEEASESSEAMVLFRLGEEWLGLEVAAVAEVAAPRPTHRIPHRDNRVLTGVANFRGELQLCVSLAALMRIEADAPGPHAARPGLPTAKASLHRMLVCERLGKRWAFMADEVAGVHRLAIDQLGQVPSTIAKNVHRLINAVFKWEGKSVGRLDPGRLFDSLEQLIG